MFGICNLSIVPCRKEPSDASEMVTQLLFGEHFEIIEEQKKWSKIHIAHDKYECWIGNKQFQKISDAFTKSLHKDHLPLTADLLQIATGPENNVFPLLLGSTLPYFRAGNFNLESKEYSYSGEIAEPKESREQIVENAFLYLNAPYLWGGRSPFGIDCSGLTQMAYRLSGLPLKRDAWQQAEQGITLSFLEEAQEGDLAFFDNEEGRIIHVGIILKDNFIIHASGKVRIDPIDHYGIFNTETKTYSHQLRLLKSLI